MGRDKATLPFGRGTLLAHVVGRLAPVVDEVVVVARPGQDVGTIPSSATLTHDRYTEQGPLAGLLAGLEASTADACYAAACDVPFLQPAVVELVFERLGETRVAVIEAEGRLHPLAAVYRRDTREAIRSLLDAGRLRPVFLYDLVATAVVPEADVRGVDPGLESLENVNTPAAYEAAANRQAERGGPIHIELYGTARRLAGCAGFDVDGHTLGEALAAARKACPALVGSVLTEEGLAPHWRACLNGRDFVEDLSLPLGPGDAILIVSALAGG